MMAAMLGGQAGPGGQAEPAQDTGMDPGMDTGKSLRVALMHIQSALQDEPDDEDSQKLAKVAADLYALLVGRQKEADDALQGRTTPRFLRRNG